MPFCNNRYGKPVEISKMSTSQIVRALGRIQRIRGLKDNKTLKQQSDLWTELKTRDCSKLYACDTATLKELKGDK
jgi:hypothetical protein